jgi:hypothetical protein
VLRGLPLGVRMTRWKWLVQKVGGVWGWGEMRWVLSGRIGLNWVADVVVVVVVVGDTLYTCKYPCIICRLCIEWAWACWGVGVWGHEYFLENECHTHYSSKLVLILIRELWIGPL